MPRTSGEKDWKNDPNVGEYILKGNLVNHVDKPSTKHCNYCGHGNNSSRKHEHILFNDSWPWRNRALAKKSENWRYE